MEFKQSPVTFLSLIFFIMKDLYFCSPNSGDMSGIYSIPLNGLKDGGYSYDFEVGDDFFEFMAVRK
jgi:hypothetical protein